jgi:hypothetical protein
MRATVGGRRRPLSRFTLHDIYSKFKRGPEGLVDDITGGLEKHVMYHVENATRNVENLVSSYVDSHHRIKGAIDEVKSIPANLTKWGAAIGGVAAVAPKGLAAVAALPKLIGSKMYNEEQILSNAIADFNAIEFAPSISATLDVSHKALEAMMPGQWVKPSPQALDVLEWVQTQASHMSDLTSFVPDSLAMLPNRAAQLPLAEFLEPMAEYLPELALLAL